MTGLSLGLGTKLNDIAIHFTTNRVGSAECPLIAKSGHLREGSKVGQFSVPLMGWGAGGSARKALNVLKFIALLQVAVIVDDNSLVRD